MSTDYKPSQRIRMDELFDGRLEPLGIIEKVVTGETSSGNRCLTNGRSYLWVYGREYVDCMTRFRLSNLPRNILTAIAKVFETDIFSEHEPQYWGFDTQEDWDHAMQELADVAQSEFYAEVIKFINALPNEIRSGTVGMTKAEIARDLVAANPGLIQPNSKAELLRSVEDVYEAEHATIIELTTGDLEQLKLITTHEDDMPHA